jgi:hypothetical protein
MLLKHSNLPSISRHFETTEENVLTVHGLPVVETLVMIRLPVVEALNGFLTRKVQNMHANLCNYFIHNIKK